MGIAWERSACEIQYIIKRSCDDKVVVGVGRRINGDAMMSNKDEAECDDNNPLRLSSLLFCCYAMCAAAHTTFT